MSRRKRILIAGMPHHLIQRGNNRQPLFLDDEDRTTYLRILAIAMQKHEIKLHAWILMDNHVHLLATPDEEPSLSRAMQYLGGTYVQYFNEKYARTGTLFEGRFRSSVVDSDAYLLTCYRYIEENPVRAGLCKSPDQFAWSSYHANAGAAFNPMQTPHKLYTALGQGPKERAGMYKRLFAKPLAPETLDKIAVTVERFFPLGSDRFVKTLEQRCGASITPKRRGGDRRSKKYQLTGR